MPAIAGSALTVHYIAWDTSNNTGATGDAANHTLKWVTDGDAAATTTNSASELAYGVYKVALTTSETSGATFGTLYGDSSTANVEIIPVSVQFHHSVASISDDVWTEALADHDGTSGSVAEALRIILQAAAGKNIADEGDGTLKIYDTDDTTVLATLTFSEAGDELTRTTTL